MVGSHAAWDCKSPFVYDVKPFTEGEGEELKEALPTIDRETRWAPGKNPF